MTGVRIHKWLWAARFSNARSLQSVISAASIPQQRFKPRARGREPVASGQMKRRAADFVGVQLIAEQKWCDLLISDVTQLYSIRAVEPQRLITRLRLDRDDSQQRCGGCSSP
jgi:hypothetical protein